MYDNSLPNLQASTLRDLGSVRTYDGIFAQSMVASEFTSGGSRPGASSPSTSPAPWTGRPSPSAKTSAAFRVFAAAASEYARQLLRAARLQRCATVLGSADESTFPLKPDMTRTQPTAVKELISNLFPPPESRKRPRENAIEDFMAGVKTLANPEREIEEGIRSILSTPDSGTTQLWLLAAQVKPSPLFIDPLCQILTTPGLMISYESVVDALCPLRSSRAIPALLTAFEYELDFDPGRAMQASILCLLAETDATRCESVFRAAAEDHRDDNVRETARGILVEVFGEPEFDAHDDTN